jgi:hypothetical protein
MLPRTIKQIPLFSFFTFLACFSGAKPSTSNTNVSAAFPGRLVALGDVHGDPQRAKEALKLAALVDEEGHWIGGAATFVQLGDMVDRGPDSKGAIALFRRLQEEAPKSGGKVIVVMGNHEAMNMQGDWRYVSPEDLASYGGKEARTKAFSAEGEEGKWIQTLPAVAKVGDTIFVHGGVIPTWASKGIDAINQELTATLKPGLINTDPDQPLWYRGFINGAAEQECALLDESLRLLGARRMVVGHTRSPENKIRVRCGGKLVGIDVSLSGFYPDGRVGILEINAGDAKALYVESTEDLIEP